MAVAGMTRRVVLTVTLPALFAACTVSHEVVERDAGEESAAPSGGWCSRIAAIQCDGEQRCCEAELRSREHCERELADACEEGVYLDQIAMRPESGFDAVVAERTLAELARRVARCDPSAAAWAASAQGLRRMFRGTRGKDERCNPTGGFSTDPALVAAALTTCRSADDLACLPQDGLVGEWRCTPKRAIGQSCLTDDNCRDGDACSNFGQAQLGTCVARLPLGAACEQAAHCASLQCVESCSEPDVQTVYCPQGGQAPAGPLSLNSCAVPDGRRVTS